MRIAVSLKSYCGVRRAHFWQNIVLVVRSAGSGSPLFLGNKAPQTSRSGLYNHPYREAFGGWEMAITGHVSASSKLG